jgi:hypothetical protein
LIPTEHFHTGEILTADASAQIQMRIAVEFFFSGRLDAQARIEEKASRLNRAKASLSMVGQ